MISEIDIRDWDRSIEAARSAVASIDAAPYPYKEAAFIDSFIDKVEAHIYSNSKQVAALFKPATGYDKMVDGCCHQSVSARCADCPFKLH